MNADTIDRESTATLRVPPHSAEAEQSVLGALLLDNRAFDRVADVVAEGDFYRREHRLIFGAIAGLVLASREADVVTVFERLQAAGTADEVGGLQHLNALAQSVPGAGNARRYAEIVAERATLRGIIAACDDGATGAFNPQGRSASAVLDAVAQKLALLERRSMRRQPKSLRDLLPERLDAISALADGEKQAGMSTSIPRIDRMMAGGLRPGHVYVLAARPSVGKSSFAEAIGLHVAECHGPVLMLSQEMPDAEVADRALSGLGRIDYEGVQTGKLSQEEWSRLADAVERGQHLPFYVDDQPALRIGDIRAKARQVKGLKLLIVDYLQLCDGDGDNRNAEIEQISRALKALAKELGFAVLALSQLNREVEKRATKEPMLSDLRDSGAIEQDADVVMFLWPVSEFDGGSKLVGVKLEKNRQGRKGRFALDFHGAHQRWAESTEALPTHKGSKGGFE